LLTFTVGRLVNGSAAGRFTVSGRGTATGIVRRAAVGRFERDGKPSAAVQWVHPDDARERTVRHPVQMSKLGRHVWNHAVAPAPRE